QRVRSNRRMKEPVAGASCSEQHDVQRRESRSRASSGNKSKGNSGTLSVILFRPAARARYSAQKRRWKPRRRDAGPSGSGRVLVITFGIAEQSGSGFFRLVEDLACFLCRAAGRLSGFILDA